MLAEDHIGCGEAEAWDGMGDRMRLQYLSRVSHLPIYLSYFVAKNSAKQNQKGSVEANCDLV